jgi:hypothetical protein
VTATATDTNEIDRQLPHDFSGYPSTMLAGTDRHLTKPNTAALRSPDETTID